MKNEGNKEYLTSSLDIETEHKEPSLFRVVMHNDDFTPMEFVADILEKFFFMSRRQAIDIMTEVHTAGRAICGIFSRDVAESKIADVTDHSRMHEHPLLCSLESD